MKDFFERITEITKNEGINITTLEQRIGASQGVLSRAKRNSTTISSEWIIKILENYPKYNANWLLKGKGEMIENGGIDEAEVTFLKEKNILLQKNSKLLEEKVERLEEELTALKKRILFTEETESKIA